MQSHGALCGWGSGKRFTVKAFVVSITLGAYVVSNVCAGEVRTLAMNDDKMEPIRLAMGKSTVLRLPESPHKTIVGNQNYYKIEFVNNDITIQPQGSVPTNLFIYAGKRIYGFLLVVESGGGYDDLVKVFWKSAKRNNAPVANHHPDTFLGKDLRVSVKKVFTIRPGVEIAVVDLTIENRMERSVLTKEITFRVVGEKERIIHSETVFDREEVGKDQKVKVRIFVRDMGSVYIKFENYKAKVAEMGPS